MNEMEESSNKSNLFKLTIRKKLIIGFDAVLLLLALIIIIANNQLTKVHDNSEHLIEDHVNLLVEVKTLKEQLPTMANANRGYLLTGESIYLQDYNKSLTILDQTIDSLSKSINTTEGKNYIEKMKQNKEKYNELSLKVRELKDENNEKAYTDLMKHEVRQAGHQFQKDADAFVSYQQKQLSVGTAKSAKVVNDTKRNLIIIGIIAIILGIGISVIISIMLVRPVILISNAMKQVAAGDLSIPPLQIKNKDEIGTLASSFNGMTKDLNSVITHISESANLVAASSEELSASSQQSTAVADQVAKIAQDNAAGISKQLNYFTEVTESIHELSNDMDQIATSSKGMLLSTDNALSMTKKGSQSVENTVTKMQQIHATVDHSTSLISALGDRSKDINGIASLITNIADQTNLLALNAAIEAARAGEHGKGFAVVADEVRKLAEESKNSADQITELIQLILKETEQAVESMIIGTKQVKEGITSSEDTLTAFNEITNAINDVANEVNDVSSAVEEINTVSNDITAAILHVREIAQQSFDSSHESSTATEEQLATIEEVSSSAQALSALAEDLQNTIARFKV